MKKKWRLEPLEFIDKYSNYEIAGSETSILLTYNEKAFYDQVKRNIINESKVSNIAFDDDALQINIHSLTPDEGEPDNMSYNMRVSFSYNQTYCFWLYFDEERIRIFTMHRIPG